MSINKIKNFIAIKIPTNHHRDQVHLSLSTGQLDPITEHLGKRVIFSILPNAFHHPKGPNVPVQGKTNSELVTPLKQ